MAGAMLFNIVVYGMIIAEVQESKYYIARTRYKIVQEIDFEAVEVSTIEYFLYKDPGEEPVDAGDNEN